MDDMKGFYSGIGVTAVIAAIVLYLVRPIFQPLVYNIIYTPSLLILAIAALCYGAARLFSEHRTKLRTAGTVLIVLGLLTGFVNSTNVLEKPFVMKEVQDRVQEIDALPAMDADNPRIVPRSVAYQYAQNTLREPQYRISAADDITMVNGTPHWSFGLEPNAFTVRFFGKQKGAVYVDMTSESTAVKTVEDPMSCGMGMQITDNIDWQLPKHNYFVNYRDKFMVSHQGENYIAVPYIQHEYQYNFLPFTVPRFKGVALVDNECDISYLDPDEAQQHPVLQDQNFYPYTLVPYYVSSLNWRHGIFNLLFTKEDVFEIAPVPGYNDQPFTVKTEDGLEYVLAVEPYGDADGIYRLFVIDGRTGDISQVRLPEGSSLYGPERATRLVKSTDELSLLDWNEFGVAEPLPAMINGTLHWQVKIIPRDSSTVSRIAFVNAENRDIVTFTNAAQVSQFLEEGAAASLTTENQTAEVSDTSSSQGEIIIRDKDGDVVQRYNLTGYSVEVR